MKVRVFHVFAKSTFAPSQFTTNGLHVQSSKDDPAKGTLDVFLESVQVKHIYQTSGVLPKGVLCTCITVWYEEVSHLPKDTLEEIFSRDVYFLKLRTRALNVLRRVNIMTLGDLCCKTEYELSTRYSNIGRKTILEIRTKLKALGLHLGMNVKS